MSKWKAFFYYHIFIEFVKNCHCANIPKSYGAFCILHWFFFLMLPTNIHLIVYSVFMLSNMFTYTFVICYTSLSCIRHLLYVPSRSLSAPSQRYASKRRKTATLEGLCMYFVVSRLFCSTFFIRLSLWFINVIYDLFPPYGTISISENQRDRKKFFKGKRWMNGMDLNGKVLFLGTFPGFLFSFPSTSSSMHSNIN